MDQSSEVQPVQGTLWRLQGIFFEPRQTFQAIDRKPNFLLPLVLTTLISFAGIVVMFSYVEMEDVIRSRIESSPQGDRMTREQIESTVDSYLNSPLAGIMQYGMPFILPLVLVLAVSALMLMMIYLAGGATTYLKLFSVTSHIYFLYYFLYTAAVVTIYTFSSNPQAVNLQNPVISNPGPLVDASQSPVLHRILISFDLFTIYAIFLLGLGASVVSRKLTLSAGIGLVALLYGLYVAIAIFFIQIFG